MEVLRLYVLFSVVPMALLLALCFFVILAMSKSEKKFVNVIGSIVVALLAFSAVVVFATGVYSFATGKGCMMKKMMHHKKQYMMYPGHSGYMQPGSGKKPGCGKAMHYKMSTPVENITQ